MSRREFPKAVKVAAFQRANGHCENPECGARLTVGKFHYDHVLADGLGGEPTLDNCACLCSACHSAKTGRHDVPKIAKAKRQHAGHIGARKPTSRPIPGSKASGWRKRMDGTAERRR